MRILIFPWFILLFVGCSQDKPIARFELLFEIEQDGATVSYSLTDTSLQIATRFAPILSVTSVPSFYVPLKYSDTLRMISQLNSKSYDCPIQHVLQGAKITFTTDSGTVHVDANVNHPKELDYAVRIINSVVPEKYKLKFIDMQPAIEPEGKLEI